MFNQTVCTLCICTYIYIYIYNIYIYIWTNQIIRSRKLEMIRYIIHNICNIYAIYVCILSFHLWKTDIKISLLRKLFGGSSKYIKSKGSIMMMMMMNWFGDMVHQRKIFSLISSRDRQRSSPSLISDMPRAGFETARNLSSRFD